MTKVARQLVCSTEPPVMLQIRSTPSISRKTSKVTLLRYTCIRGYYHFATKELLQAIEKEDTLKVEQLLNEGVDPNMLQVPPGKIWCFLEYSQDWPLSMACKTGNLKTVELLISYPFVFHL